MRADGADLAPIGPSSSTVGAPDRQWRSNGAANMPGMRPRWNLLGASLMGHPADDAH